VNFTVNVDVVDRAVDGFLLSWRNSQPTDDTLAAAFEMLEETDPDLAAQIRSTVEIPVLIETDGCGSYIQTRNWLEIRAATIQSLELMFPALAEAEDLTENEVDLALDVLAETLDAPGAEFALLGDTLIFFEMLGFSLFPGQSFSLRDETANPLGGEPFPTNMTYSLGEFGPSTGCGVAVRESQIDAEEVIRILAEDQPDQFGITPGEDAIAPFSIDDRAETEFCEGDLWPSLVVFTREVITDEGTFRERLEYREAE
jgi:hypothetical protein